MPNSIHVHLLPQLISQEELTGSLVVVIDVLRATTTVCHALSHGARAVIPCLDIEEARRIAAQFSPGDVLLGGERGGLPIDGFDLGNSPGEYSRETVAGKTIVFTTTNGTRALGHCQRADRVVLAALVNLAAVCTAIEGATRIDLLCAGTRGQISREDVLAAGAIADMIVGHQTDSAPDLNDAAHLARDAWLHVTAAAASSGQTLSAQLAHEFRSTLGGQNVLRIGRDDDLLAAAQLDKFAVVPQLDRELSEIRLA